MHIRPPKIQICNPTRVVIYYYYYYYYKPNEPDHPTSRFPMRIPLGNNVYLSPNIDFITYKKPTFTKSTSSPPKSAHLNVSNIPPFVTRSIRLNRTNQFSMGGINVPQMMGDNKFGMGFLLLTDGRVASSAPAVLLTQY